MERVAVLAITRNGVAVGRKLTEAFGGWELHAPEKFGAGGPGVAPFAGPASEKVAELFGSHDGLVCVFSLGAAIRLIAPHMRDKRTDPAVVVIDDAASFAISALSGHLGGANRLAAEIASRLGATPVITTAADVNKTIAVDLVGREFGWVIDDGSAVTAVSADMVNGEGVAVYQGAGERGWWAGELPGNVRVFDSLGGALGSGLGSCLIISDEVAAGAGGAAGAPPPPPKSVTYRPKSLVVGVGLHRDTSKEAIRGGIEAVFRGRGLSTKSIYRVASVKKRRDAGGLAELGREMGVPVEYVDREDLGAVAVPNPSDVVRAFEGTASVSEAAALLVSGGDLVVEKQKFPPDLTVAVARRRF